MSNGDIIEGFNEKPNNTLYGPWLRKIGSIPVVWQAQRQSHLVSFADLLQLT